jgi:hypothetical protein
MSMATTSDATIATAARPGADRLAELRGRIARVRRRRWLVRAAAGLSRLGIAVVLALAVVFLVDWLFSPGRVVRGLLLLAALAAVARTYWRRVRPWFQVKESEVDIALAVEKKQGLDSDLVAALEFDRRRDAASGSADLRDAVVDYVADFGRSWELPLEVPDARVRRRLAWLAAAVVAIGVGAVMRPDVAAAFVNRLFLGAAHYPTRTRIESLTIGGRPVDLAAGAAPLVPCMQGRPLLFEAGIGGEEPRIARLRIASAASGATTEVELFEEASAHTNGDDETETAAVGLRRFTARLPKLAETVDVQVFAGDAWTDPVRVAAIEPPLVDVSLSATPPAYAGSGTEQPPPGARQVTVLEGSRVGLAVACTNKKLAIATLVVAGVEHPLAPSGGTVPAAAWELAAADSPLANLAQSVGFEIRVVDEDGFGADMPLVGSIRVKADASPRVVADVQTRLVLPTATPKVAWRVADDHAIGGVTIVAERVSQSAVAISEPTTLPVALDAAGRAGWVARDRLPLAGTAAVPLGKLGLEVGDQVRLTVRAVDYRGTRPGKPGESEQIILEVTDERGIIAALAESDEQSVQQLDAIIERELIVGGGK